MEATLKAGLELKQAIPSLQNDQIQPFLVEKLTPGLTNWAIIARVIYKGPIVERKSDHLKKFEVFSLDLVDSQGGEIKMIFYRDLCLKHYPQIKVGRIYKIAGGEIKKSTTVFHGFAHDSYIECKSNSAIELLPDDSKIPALPKLACVCVKDLARIKPEERINFAGIVLNAETLIINEGKSSRRELVLLDANKDKITLHLNGVEAEVFKSKPGDRILFRNLSIFKLEHEYVLSFRDWSSVFTTGIDELTEIKGLAAISESFNSELLTKKEEPEEKKEEKDGARIQEESHGAQLSDLSSIKAGAPGVYYTKASIRSIDQESSLYYLGCGNCLKKATSNVFVCSCGYNNKAPYYRYRLKVILKDDRDQLEAIAFDSTALILMLNLPASTLREWQLNNYSKLLSSLFEQVVSKELLLKIARKVQQNQTQYTIEGVIGK